LLYKYRRRTELQDGDIISERALSGSQLDWRPPRTIAIGAACSAESLYEKVINAFPID